MTPLKNEQKESIVTRLAFIEQEVNDFKAFEGVNWQTYSTQRDKQRNIERIAENLANASIDIAKIVLAGEAIEMPGSYKEAMQKLGLMKIIPMELAGELMELVEVRNALAHQYLDIKWDKIKFFIINGSRIINQFADLIQKFVS